MQMTDKFVIHRLADKSAFVVFNRLNWQTHIVNYEQLVEKLQNKVMPTISADDFAALTGEQQIAVLFEQAYWETLS